MLICCYIIYLMFADSLLCVSEIGIEIVTYNLKKNMCEVVECIGIKTEPVSCFYF